MSSNSFFPLINKPTRITSDSATLIDNIFTNDFSDHKIGILLTDISDHLPVFTVINNYSTNISFNRNSSRRDFSDTNIQHFIQDLLDINWDFVTNFDSVNDSYSHFLEYVLHLYNKHFPEKEICF